MHRREPTLQGSPHRQPLLDDDYLDDDEEHAPVASPRGYSRRAVRHRDDDVPAPYAGRTRGRFDDQDYEDERFEDEDQLHEGAGLIDRVLAAPGRAIMSLVALIAFAVVGVNAAYLQPGAHPSPMLSTRAQAPADALPMASLAPTAQSIAMAPAPIVPPSRSYEATASIPAQSVLAAGTRAPYRAPAPVARPAELARAASPVNAAPVAPVVASAPVTNVTTAPRPVETIAVVDPIGALLAPVIGAAQGSGQPLPLSGAETRSAQPLVAAVQSVLAEMGYAPGSVDGVIGPGTEEAIRRFQLRRALEPNGQITTELLQEIERVTGTRISQS